MKGQEGVRELGLRETLVRTHEIVAIVDPSPPVAVALHRLLLAILHRSLGPGGSAAWRQQQERGQWDEVRVNDYLERWRHRFDLFSDSKPFYQAADPSVSAEGYRASIRKLALELGATNHPLFSHVDDQSDLVVSAAQAARWTVAYHGFAPGGTVTHEEGKQADKFATGGPLSRGALSLPCGSSLFRTLLLNMMHYRPDEGIPCPHLGDDRPAWERDEDVRPVERHPNGYVDWLTWQSRRLRLIPETDGDATPRVRKCVIMKGFQLPKGSPIREYETMLAFQESKKATPDQDPFPVVGFSEDRAVWRDSGVLFQSVQGKRPKTLDWLAEVGKRTDTLPLDLYGICGNRAIVVFWRHDRLPLPLAYLSDKELYDRLHAALRLAEEVGKAVRLADWKLAQLILAPQAEEPAGRQPAPKVVSELASRFATSRVYWSLLDTRFSRFLVDQADEREQDEYDNVNYGKHALLTWADHVGRAARDSLRDTTNTLDTSGRALKAASRATRELNRDLGRIWKEHAMTREEEMTHAATG